MSDDDPFAVVAPSEKKMSTYLKKSKDPNSRKCVETSSHGTNSTRSTATSTLTSDDVNFFPSKSLDKSSKHKSSKANPFHNSSNSGGSANFDFGDGLEFGQAFPDTPFGEDAFGTMDQGGFDTTQQQRKAQSSRNFKSSKNDPFLSYPAGPKSMKNLSSTPTKGSFDAFGADDPFKGIDDGFGSFGNGDDDDDGFLFQDDPFGKDAFAQSPFAEEDVGFSQTALKTGESRENSRRGSRENVRGGARSRSGERPKRSSSAKRRGGNPRRNTSSNDLSAESIEEGPSPRAGSRKAPRSSRHLDFEGTGLNDASSSHSKRRENSPRHGDEHSPVRRTRGGVRSNRRSALDHSGHTQNSDARSQHSDLGPPRPLSLRRGSVSCAYSDGSLEPATIAKGVPVRNKSLTGPSHRPSEGRRQRRASITHIATSDLSFMSQDTPSKDDQSDDNEKDDGWNNERSRNQEKIMDMTRGGTKLSGKSDHRSNDSSLDHIGKHLDMMALSTDESAPSSNDAGASRGRLRRVVKKEKKKDEEEYKEPKDMKDRTKGSLLDRLAGGGDSSSSLNELPSTSSRGKPQSNGLSYSDRIMLAQQRSKPN